MKRMFWAILLTVLPIHASPQGNGLMIEGRVLRWSNSAALPDVLVLLSGPADTVSPAKADSNLAAQMQVLRSRLTSQVFPERIEESVRDVLKTAGYSASSARYVLTDPGGRFAFRDLPPGSYMVHAVREGYFGPKVDGNYQRAYVKTVELSPEKSLVLLDIRLAEAGVIKGHVSNARSLFRTTTPVTVYRMSYINGREKWIRDLVTTTDSNRDFLLRGVAPGEVYIGAEGTYYRDVTQPDMATKIVVKEGETVSIDLNIQSGVLAQPRRVSGSALNPYAIPNAAGVVDFSVSTFLVAPLNPNAAEEPYTRFTNSLRSADGRRTNGEFDIGPIPPGNYELISYWTEPTTRRTLVGRAPFQLVGANVNGVSVPIRPGATLSGEFKVAGIRSDNVRPGSFSLQLESMGVVPTAFVTEPNPIGIDVSGRFLALNVPEERYAFHVGQLPLGAYVDDIRAGDRSVFDDGYELTNGAGEIQIVIRTEGQSVGGTVRTVDGVPADTATVVLVPPAERRKNLARYRVVHTDTDGVFRMVDVPPGEYTIYAWESVLPTAWMNAKFLEKYVKRGRPLTVTAGVPQDLQLTLIPDVN